MALFKVYHGDDPSEDLPETITDGYGYVLVNEEAEGGSWGDDKQYGIGEWYIDVRPNPAQDGKRYRFAAAQLIDEEGNLYTLDDIVRENSLVEDFIGAIWNSSSSISRLTFEQQESIRSALDVAKSDDSIAKAFSITIASSNWVYDNISAMYKNEVTLTEALKCGKEGALTPVPPVITWGIESKELFDLIADAQLDDNDKRKLTFYVKSVNYTKVQSTDISIIVIDYR